MGDRDNAARRISVEHERIVEELAALPESERRAIVHAADEEARRRARAVASWDTIESLTGLVHVGGDAVEDCRRACES
jgi:acyl-CoA reductase-like NAD-dependent aldehyde dehydrogenase